MRLLFAAAVSLALGLVVVYISESRAPAEEPAAEKLAAVKQKFDTEFADLSKRAQAAETRAEINGIQTEMRELVAITADKALKIAKAEPKSEAGFEAASFVVDMAAKVGASERKEVAEAVELLAEHHAANPGLKDMLIPAMRLGDAGEKLLTAVSEKTADKDTKGLALFIRGYMASQEAGNAETDDELKTIKAKATKLFEQAMQISPDAKVGAGTRTVGDLAKREIESLKAMTIVAIGSPAPDVATKTLAGEDIKLSDYKGKVVLLDVWATWCGPCRAMIPHERELVKSMKDKPFLLVSVSADDKKETLEKFLEKEEMPWVHWWDNGTDNPILKKYRIQAFPTLFLIDHTGVVREKWVGSPGNDKLDAAVEKLVEEALKAKG